MQDFFVFEPIYEQFFNFQSPVSNIACSIFPLFINWRGLMQIGRTFANIREMVAQQRQLTINNESYSFWKRLIWIKILENIDAYQV